MGDFINKAKDFTEKHDKQIDEGMKKAGEMADKRTGGKYEQQIDKAVETAQQRTGRGEQAR